MLKSVYQKHINDSLLDKGIKMIILAFNEQKNEFMQSISSLKSEIKKLKDENYLYKNKLTILQKKLNSLSKTVLLLDEDTEESKNDEEKKTMMQTFNNENKNKKNNFISRNSRVFITKNLSMKTKKNSLGNDEDKKIINSNNLNNTCTRHKRPYTNNFKNLKYVKNNQTNYDYNKITNNLNTSDNASNNSDLNNLKNLNMNGTPGGELNDTSEDNTKIYQKLNLFLEKCQKELNSIEYENILELLKSFQNDSDINIRKKMKKIIKDKTNLKELFDDIFEG